MDAQRKAQKLFSHFLKARGPFRVHSPFIYTFFQRVLRGQGAPGVPAVLAEHRRRLERSSEIITHSPRGQDEGRVMNESVSSLARRIALSRRDTGMLYRLALFLKPAHILELGGGLGNSTLALRCGAPAANLISVEGDQEAARLAEEHLRLSGITDVDLRTGNFRDVLPSCLAGPRATDLVFLDGDHCLDETLYLCQEILPSISRHGVLAVHDIHSSDEMLEAWSLVRGLPEVTASITTWTTGFLFVNESLSRQHFRLRR